jgi:D-glycero-alpha-D-manno-heptose-7-phosphate kinase
LIITRTPFRISLFGGGTDFPKWYDNHGGAVIGTAINRYCYITLRRLPPFFEYKHRIVYSKIELAKDNADIVHPSVRAVFQDKNISEGMELHHNGDLPALSGLGSSSSFTVGLLNSYHALNGAMSSKMDLAKEAIRI